jgi:ABC-2 type transport system ATP-binding protein
VSEAAVIVDDVSKRFRLYHERNQSLKAALMRGRRAVVEEFWALQEVSFEVTPGTTFGLIGENGSGKSTLLKCLARILRPDKGSLKVNGKVSALLELGAGFHPELSGRENVFLNGAILGLTQKELGRKFDQIVDFAGLGQFIDQPVKNYSSGMYVRLGFSVAINVDPDVLFVDEVLSVGDEAFQRKCNEKFADLRAAGKTIVLVSHSMSQVNTLCDEVVWLEHGRVKQVGAAHEVIDKYMGNVHFDRQVADEAGHVRWGSGEARIVKVEMLDASGAAVERARTGDPVTFRMHFEADQPIAKPVFGFGIDTVEGVHLTGPNNRDGNCVPDQIEGRGHIDLNVDRLMLLKGTYDVTVSINDHSILHQYDVIQKAFRFDVDPGDPYDPTGLVSLGGSWRMSNPVAER